ncbi:MAG: ABC transporter substrate-binding protein [Acetobacteraceae bacterium]|nr:ABC transporter substrate-binding protein [Acetobacteraceae bacterium]
MSSLQIGRRTLLAGTAGLATAAPFRRLRAAEVGPVRIGILNDENGPYAASSGSGSVLAARMAIADFGPTVLGRPIEIVHGDTLNKPDVASAIARRWFDEMDVDMITDLPVTPIAAAVQQVAVQKGRSVIITAAAVTEFTSKACAPTSIHWADDTHALTTGVVRPIVQHGGKSWFFITVDMAFGTALEKESAAIIEAGGGKFLGSARFPLGATDFSSMILQAQNSGADVIGLAAVGGELVNLIKQANEFGITHGGKQTLAGFLIYLTDIHALGLDVANSFILPSSFYWDQNDQARAWSKRFFAEQKAIPTRSQATIYSVTTHFLKSMAHAGTRDPLAVNKAMRALPAEYHGNPTTIRADGRALYNVSLYKVKSKAESKMPWDYYQLQGTMPASEAFQAMTPSCAS